MKESVIIETVRTPLARKDGAFAQIRPDELYSIVVNELTKRTKIDLSKIDDLITGCVTQCSEQGANLSRQVALLSQLPQTVPGVTLNRMCGSGQQAIHFAAQAIEAGDADFIIAGGVESMTRVPMFSDIGGGYEKLNPRLREKYELVHQGESAERIAEKFGLSRTDVDNFSVESHRRAAKAVTDKKNKEIIPVEGRNKEGQSLLLEFDEGIRFQLDPAKMAKLPTIFRKDGVVTAANASQISDGAACALIANREKAVALGLKPRARFVARMAVGGDPAMQLIEVISATRRILERAKLSIKDIDIIEINEAFASVVLAWMKEFRPDPEKVNPNGGAIAHGHPLGATGAVLMGKLINELERRDKEFGLQVMCIGHGMATATIVQRV